MVLCSGPLLHGRQVVDLEPNLPGRSHRFEGGGYYLGGPGAVLVLIALGFEQLRMRENDAKLIVQAMEQLAQVFIVVMVNGF